MLAKLFLCLSSWDRIDKQVRYENREIYSEMFFGGVSMFYADMSVIDTILFLNTVT